MSQNRDASVVKSVQAGKVIIAQVAHIYNSDKALTDEAFDRDKRHAENCIAHRDRRVGNPAKKIFGEIQSPNCENVPMRMPQPSLAIMVHVFPRQAFDPVTRLNLELLSENETFMAALNGWETTTWNRPWKLKHRFNRDGLLLYHPTDVNLSIRPARATAPGVPPSMPWVPPSIRATSSRDDYCDQYIQFHDNGIVEAVDGELMAEVLHTMVIPGTLFEMGLRRIIPQVITSLQFVGASFPLHISISIRGNLEFAKVSYAESDIPDQTIGIKDELLVLPWLKLDNIPEMFDPILRPCFDFLARASGRPRSPNFDKQGIWVGPPGVS